MPVVNIRIEGGKRLRKALDRLDPAANHRIFRKSLRQAALLLATNAKHRQIAKGGGAVKPGRLTNRSGWLKDSIGPNYHGLPIYVEVGTKVPYAAVHEFGGTYKIKTHRAKSKRTGESWTVKAHTAHFPERPFLAPALNAIAPKIPGIVIRNWKLEAGL